MTKAVKSPFNTVCLRQDFIARTILLLRQAWDAGVGEGQKGYLKASTNWEDGNTRCFCHAVLSVLLVVVFLRNASMRSKITH